MDKKALINGQVVDYDICFSTFSESAGDEQYFEYICQGVILDESTKNNSFNQPMHFWKAKDKWK